jgi:hypothetical protein
MQRPPIKWVRDAAPPANPYYRTEFQFMAGWIALRFLADPATALKHFARVDDGTTDPTTLARAAYWRGRAAEAAGLLEEMQARRIALDRALAPSMMNSRGTAGSSPRSTRLSINH